MDTGITHPTQFDFFLNSHAGLLVSPQLMSPTAASDYPFASDSHSHMRYKTLSVKTLRSEVPIDPRFTIFMRNQKCIHGTGCQFVPLS